MSILILQQCKFHNGFASHCLLMKTVSAISHRHPWYLLVSPPLAYRPIVHILKSIKIENTVCNVCTKNTMLNQSYQGIEYLFF